MTEKVQGRARVAVFASGAGSNAEALIQGSHRIESAYSIVLFISNNSRCGAMDIAAMYDIPRYHISAATHPDPKGYVQAMLNILRREKTDLIALAGYMKRLPGEVIERYRHRVFNIHPALLPLHGGAGMFGAHVHEAVLRAGATETGATVHCVEGEYDTGTILAQAKVSVLPGDTPETLSDRVRLSEHALYPDVLQQQAESFLQYQSV